MFFRFMTRDVINMSMIGQKMHNSITFIFSCSVTTDPTLQNGGAVREEEDEEGITRPLLQ